MYINCPEREQLDGCYLNPLQISYVDVLSSTEVLTKTGCFQRNISLRVLYDWDPWHAYDIYQKEPKGCSTIVQSELLPL